MSVSQSYPGPTDRSWTDYVSERRRKCDIPAPGSSCSYCSARGLFCTRKQVSVPKESSTPEESITGTVSIPEKCTLPDQPLCTELVELYFDYVHDKFHSLFHRPSLIEDIRRGQAPENLLYGILALSARYAFNSARMNQNLTRVDFRITFPLPTQILEKEGKDIPKDVNNCST